MEKQPAKAALDGLIVQPSESQALNYMPQLDGLRAVAISLVLIGHFHSKANEFLIPLSWLGVQLFFVLSGYLITRIIQLQKQKIDSCTLKKSVAIRTFYVRRMLRLFPLYYVVIALTLLLDVEKAREIWPYLVFYLTNLKIALNAGWIGDFSHLWSLAAEEQFYLLWPWLIIFLPAKYLPRVLVLVIVSGLVFRLSMVIAGQSIYSNLLIFGVTDALGMGALLALVSNMRSDTRLQVRIKSIFFKGLPVAAVLGFVGASWIFFSVEWSSATFSIWATFLTSLPFTWIVWHCSSGFTGLLGKFLSSRPVVYLGKISYGVYVIHAFVPSMLISLNIAPTSLPRGVEAWFLLIVVTTILLASVSWFFLERPANRLKSRFKY